MAEIKKGTANKEKQLYVQAVGKQKINITVCLPHSETSKGKKLPLLTVDVFFGVSTSLPDTPEVRKQLQAYINSNVIKLVQQ